MKKIIVLLLISFSATTFAQKNYYTKKGVVAKGYDVVAYFNNKATAGNEKYTTEHDGVKLKFSSQENLNTFKENPEKYLPRYGGYCAYAVAVSGKKVAINPETFEIRDGELLLFYNSGKTNTLELWKKESPAKLKAEADRNWEKIKN